MADPTLFGPEPAYKDLTGQTFNRWTVIRLHETKHSQRRWMCRCECGTEKVVYEDSVVRGTSKSCGCYRAISGKERATARVIPDRKTCRVCGIEKEISQFKKDNRNPKWVESRCLDCDKAWRDKYREDHREESNRKAKEKRAANPEVQRKKDAEYRQSHAGKVRESHRRYFERHRQRVNAATRKWQANNPERCTENRRNWEKRNRAKVRAKCAKRAALRAAAKIGDQAAVVAFYENVRTAKRLPCYWCGKRTRKDDRHVDHIIPLDKGGPHAVTNLCCSCAHCNSSKHNKLPHEFSGQHVIEFPHA